MGFLLWLVVGLIWLAAVLWLRRRRISGKTTSSLDLNLLAAGVILLGLVGFFWRTVCGDVYQPADGGDLVSFLYPTYRFAARSLSQGDLPLWNPHLYGGAPFISDIQAGFLYLPNLLLFLLRPDFNYVTLQWLAIGHLYWAGLGMYVLLRVLHWEGVPVSRPAAVFAALAFQFSDPLLIHLGNLNLIAILSWLPWVFVAYTRALERRSLSWTALAGFLFALASYAGHAQSMVYIGLALILFTLFWIWSRDTEEAAGTTRSPRLKALGLLAMVLVLAFLLTAPILFPVFELSGYSERTDFAYQDTVAFSLAPAQAIGLLTPGFFGRGPALYWSLWDRVETPYAGIATLLLALGAVLMAGNAVRRQLWPWIGIVAFGFLTALGVYAILHGWLTMVVPGFDQLRAPARALILWTFGIAVAAAVGLDTVGRAATVRAGAEEHDIDSGQFSAFRAILRTGALIMAGIAIPLAYGSLLLTQANETAFLRASVATLAIVLAGSFWLATWAVIAGTRAGWWSYAGFAGLMLALLFVDLSATGAYTDISATDPTQGFLHPEIIAFLHSDSDLYRIDTLTGIDGLWQPDAAALHNLQDVGGIANPLALQHWNQLWEATGGRQTRLYDMLNAKYVLVRDGTPLPPDKFQLAFDAPGELLVYRNTEVLPRGWLVHNAFRVADLDAAVAAIQDPGFDPQQTVVLLDGAQSVEAITGLTAESESGTVAVSQVGSGQLLAVVDAATPAYLILSEVWYPGWQATVNGEVTEVWPANGGLRAVAIPAGRSRVELQFMPRTWTWGLIAAGIGLLLLAAALGLGWVTARR